MPNYTELRRCLETLVEKYGPYSRDDDPVGLIHRYNNHEDCEAAGFLVSVLAYGNAKQIRKSAEQVLKVLGRNPADFIKNMPYNTLAERFRSFKHRWTTGVDIARLAWVLGRIIENHDSVGGFLKTLHKQKDATIENLMNSFPRWIRSRMYSDSTTQSPKQRIITSLVPSPADGSACKRLALYFRWMVRGPDGVDFGIWRFIKPSQLIVPVDTHMARIGNYLCLTSRSTAAWKTALELTESFHLINPEDPLKYDFALVRHGSAARCNSSTLKECAPCVLKPCCSAAY